jgi:hypothetical protein
MYGYAQQPSTSGTFVLHKFAKAIGKETYSIKQHEDIQGYPRMFYSTTARYRKRDYNELQ